MRVRIKANYEMAWIDLRKLIKSGQITCEGDIIHVSDLLRTMDSVLRDNED